MSIRQLTELNGDKTMRISTHGNNFIAGAVVFFVALILSGCASREVQTNKSPDAVTFAFINALLIDGISDQPIPGSTVIVSGGKIISIEHDDALPLSPDLVMIDLQGAALLPGLINTHVHLTPNRERGVALEAMLRLGVTTIRDLSGNQDLLTEFARLNPTLPNLVFSGTMFGEGFMNDPRLQRASAPYAPGEAPWMKLITEETDLPEAVSAARDAGVTGLKLYASLDADVIDRITKEAHAQGLMVWAHSVIFPAGPEAAVAAGVDELIHSKGLAALGADDVPDTFAAGVPRWMSQRPFATLDPYSDSFKALFAAMRDNRIALNPALIADGDMRMRSQPLPARMAAMRDWACTATRAAFDAGVTINTGTDYTGEPKLLFLEVERLTECGLTPMAAIKAATINAAGAVGLSETHGTIEEGKAADLLAVLGNPAIAISDLRNTVLVMKDGQVVRNDLDDT